MFCIFIYLLKSALNLALIHLGTYLGLIHLGTKTYLREHDKFIVLKQTICDENQTY